MKKEDVENWCKENKYVLIDLNIQTIPASVVIEIAESSTGIDDIRLKTQRPQYSFARQLVASYLDDHLANNKIAELINVKYDVTCYIRNLNILTTDLKYFKPWQRDAIIYFKDKINEIELTF